ncbi:MAG: MBL fold metallo-hydrolase [Symbiobacteriia bacterium]
MAQDHGPSVAAAAPGLFLFTSVLWQMNSPVLTRGDEALVVDPGYFPREVAAIREFVAGRRLRPTVLFTHGDFDHVVGWRDFPTAPRWGSAAMLARDRARVEQQIHDYDDQFYVEREQPFTFPSLGVVLPAASGLGPDEPPMRLQLADLRILIYPAPGHTADGVIAVVPELRLLICGDYLSDLEFPFVEHSLKAYQGTLARLRQLTQEFGLETLVPGHGPLALTAGAILARVAQDEAYLEALAAGVQAPTCEAGSDELVARLETQLYRGKAIPPHLLESHRGNVRLAWREANMGNPGV